MVHKNVERIRIAKGVSKTFLAKSADLTLQGYRHIASGNVRLDVERLKLFAIALDVDPSVFLDDRLTESVIKRLSNNKTA